MASILGESEFQGCIFSGVPSLLLGPPALPRTKKWRGAPPGGFHLPARAVKIWRVLDHACSGTLRGRDSASPVSPHAGGGASVLGPVIGRRKRMLFLSHLPVNKLRLSSATSPHLTPPRSPLPTPRVLIMVIMSTLGNRGISTNTTC